MPALPFPPPPTSLKTERPARHRAGRSEARMDHLRIEETPPLKDPVLITAFAGWSDAAQAATSAARFLTGVWEANRFAEIDPEDFYDFTENRPTVKIADGDLREVIWPANEAFYYRRDGAERDFIVLVG